ncbi:MAG: cupin domain-containing protein [Campylobacterota bacterium]|nr:cupin domain-containing protein [Campylobacterota bacterium]
MNIYNYTTPKTDETFTTLLKHKNIKINHIVSSSNVKPMEYIQDEDEWLVLLEGEALLLIENKEKKLFKGDTLFIPAKTTHKVLKTSDGTVWLTVHIY